MSHERLAYFAGGAVGNVSADPDGIVGWGDEGEEVMGIEAGRVVEVRRWVEISPDRSYNATTQRLMADPILDLSDSSFPLSSSLVDHDFSS